MKRIESNVKQIPYSQESVYAKVSDLSNLRDLIDRIPEDQKEKYEAIRSAADRYDYEAIVELAD